MWDELESKRSPSVPARKPGCGDVGGLMERYQHSVELPLIPLIEVPNGRLFLAVDRDDRFKLHDLVLRAGV